MKTTRTTIDAVTNILDDTALDSNVIEDYINSANVFVTAALGAKGLSDALLAEIEMWMAAHMISVTRERVYKEAGAGGAYVKYAGAWGEGLLGSTYGQMAVSLDISGTLVNIAKGKSNAWVHAIPNFD